MRYSSHDNLDHEGNILLDKISEAVISQMGTPTNLSKYELLRDLLVREETSKISGDELDFCAIWLMTSERPDVKWETSDTIFDIIMDTLYVIVSGKVDMHWEIEELMFCGELN